jgi:hypothetical protein
MRVLSKRHRPLLVIGDKVLTSHFGSVCLLDIEKRKVETICPLPVAGWKRFLSHFREIERLLRLEIKAEIALNSSEVLLSYGGVIYHVDIMNKQIEEEHRYCKEMNNPLYFARIEGVEGFDDGIAYGEYTINARRDNSSSIFMRSLKLPEWKKVFEFPAGTVRHIHGITPDRQNRCVYILTGDLDSESGIWVSRDNFRTVEPLLTGLQKYRTGFWYPVKDGFIYPTDTAVEQNYLFYAFPDKRNGEWKTRIVAELDGSCVSALNTEKTIYVSTTVEPDESITGWRSWINYKKGAGINSSYAKLIAIDKNSLNIREIAQFKKDILPYRLFLYGYVVIRNLPLRNSILLYPVGVKKYDGKLLIIDKKIWEED